MSESEPTTLKRSQRPLFIAVAVLVPLVPILVALLMGGSGGSAAVLTNAVTVPAPKFAPAPVTAATQSPPAATKAAGLELPPGHGSLVALLRHPTALHAKPGGRVLAKLPLKTQFGSPQAMWVAHHSGRWLGVVSPTGRQRPHRVDPGLRCLAQPCRAGSSGSRCRRAS